MVTLILNSLLPISSPAKLFLPVLIIISPKEDSLLLVKSFKSGLMKDLYLSKLMIGVLIPSSRLNLTLLNLILLVVLALIEVSLCMILEVKLLLKKMHLRISQWLLLGILWSLSTLLLVTMILIVTLSIWENSISSKWSIKIILVQCKPLLLKNFSPYDKFLVWILIILLLVENSPLVLMIRLSESSLSILVKVEKFIMVKECKSNFLFIFEESLLI